MKHAMHIIVMIVLNIHALTARAEGDNDGGQPMKKGVDHRTEKDFYGLGATELFLTHMAAAWKLGLYISDDQAVEIVRESVHEVWRKNQWEGRTVRLKSFWFNLPIYSAVGIHSYVSSVHVGTGEFTTVSDGARYEIAKSRDAETWGPQIAFGSQWHIYRFVLGAEVYSYFYPTHYYVEGIGNGPAARAAIEAGDRDVLWRHRGLQFNFGIASHFSGRRRD